MKTLENLHWYCDTCNAGIGSILKSVTKLEARQDACEQNFRILDANVSINKLDMDNIKKELQNVSSRLSELDRFKEMLGKMDDTFRETLDSRLAVEVGRNVEKQTIGFNDIVKQQL